MLSQANTTNNKKTKNISRQLCFCDIYEGNAKLGENALDCEIPINIYRELLKCLYVYTNVKIQMHT